MKKLKAYVLPLLTVLLISVFPVLFLYFSNAGEAGFSETLEPLAVYAAGGIACYMTCLLVCRSNVKSSLMAGLFMLLFTNFALFENGLRYIFIDLRYWQTVPIFAVVWLHAAVAICRFVSDDTGKAVVSALCLVLAGLIAFNLASGVPAIMEKANNDRLLSQAQEQLPSAVARGQKDRPNVYLLLFDEYAGFNQMKEYYGYDNAELREYLERNHFTISYDSHNESDMTTTVVTNLVNLDYMVDNTDSNTEKEPIRKQGVLYTLMREHGYQVWVAESGDFLGQESPIGDRSADAALTAAGENLTYLCYRNSAIYPFVHLNTSEVLNDVLKVVDYLSDRENIPAEPAFLLGYVCFPHEPFVTDENGNAIPSAQYHNWNDDRYYLGQYKYATKLIMRVLDNILLNDPDSIILLQSDHGARASSDENLAEVKFPIEARNNPLNAVYYRGEGIHEIEGMSSVNTLRRVLSRLFNEDYGVLDVPNT